MYSSGLSNGRFSKGQILERISGRELEGTKQEVAHGEQVHEVPVHVELNTISRGFSGGGCTTSKRKKYTKDMMAVEGRRLGQPAEPALCFTSSDLEGVVPHEDDPMVISIITVGRRVH